MPERQKLRFCKTKQSFETDDVVVEPQATSMLFVTTISPYTGIRVYRLLDGEK